MADNWYNGEDWDNDTPEKPAEKGYSRTDSYRGNSDSYNGSSARGKNYGDRQKSYGGERRSYGGERKSYSREHKSYGDERRNYGEDRKSYGEERKSYGGERKTSDRQGYGGDRQRSYGGGSNRYNSNDFSESMDVRQEHIGRIIGRGGSNIQRIENDYKVRVNVDKGSSSVTISGQSHNNVSDAIAFVKKQIDSGSDNNYRNDGYNRRNNDRFNSDDKPSSNDGYKFTDATTSIEDDDGLIDWTGIAERIQEARKVRWAKCPPMEKMFYKEAPEVAELSREQIERIRAENNNTTTSRVFADGASSSSDDIPNPIWKFEQCFASYPDLMDEIRKQGFEKPSPIQSQAWPVLLKGEDLIGIAQTGTGKTLAFLLPAMIHTEYQPVPRSDRGGPNVLILAPTRELALQIETEVNKYSFRGMKAVCVYGGGNRRDQISNLEYGAEIIICTPGRLNDLIQAGVIKVESVTFLILDEADRMLDLGFEPQIRKILLDIRPDRQTVMTSATWPAGVRRLAQSYMTNPIQVCVGSLDLAATHTVEQIIEIIDEDSKYNQLLRFVKKMEPLDKIIVFCSKKARADDLSSEFGLENICCQSIHGSRDQSDREQAIADIKSGEVRILIATDVASRGLDIEDITHVINYDFPRNIEEYVHRVGRTGRAGRRGVSISFVTREDWGVAKDLINILKEAQQEIPDELHNMADRFQAMKERRSKEMGGFRSGGRGGGGRRYNNY